MKRYPIVFSIASSDCSGGGGIQSDTKTISALGAYAASAITAITVQNTLGIKSIYALPSNVIRGQIEAIMEDMWPDVVKIGSINDVDTAALIADCMRKYHPEYVVYDPTFLGAHESIQIKNDILTKIQEILFPYANLVTINIEEIKILTGMQIARKEDLMKAARNMSERYKIPVLAKGHHLLGAYTYDVLYIPDGENWEFIGPRIETNNTHGSSSTFTAAIATYLALGEKLNNAVRKAREFLQEAIERGKDVNTGHGRGPLCHNWNPVEMHIYGNEK